MESEKEQSGAARSTGRRLRRFGGVMIALALWVAVIPYVISKSSLRDDVLPSLIGDSAVITNGSLLVRERTKKEPAIDVERVDISLQIQRRPAGSVLIVDPIQLVEREALTPDICDQGFQLVAPELSDEVSLEGEYSFFMQIPISAASDSALAQELSKTPIELRVTGTIDEPKLSVNGDQPWVSLIKERQSSPQASAGEKALADGLMKALDDFPELT